MVQLLATLLPLPRSPLTSPAVPTYLPTKHVLGQVIWVPFIFLTNNLKKVGAGSLMFWGLQCLGIPSKESADAGRELGAGSPKAGVRMRFIGL